MGWELGLVIVLTTAVLLLVAGQWIAFALGSVGLFLLFLDGGNIPAVASVGFNSVNTFVITAIPLFILMGEFILKSGLSNRFYQGVAVWLGGLPGGLLHANVAACGIFSAVSGSSVATAAAIGTVAVPDLKRRGYDPRLSYGALAAGGTLGLLIPPSLAALIYAAQVQESVSQLFIAGIIPGILLMALFSTYIAIRVLRSPELAPVRLEGVTWRDRALALGNMSPVVGLILLIVGGIYAGVVTPTEAAALGALGALTFSITLGGMRIEGFRRALEDTVKTSTMLIFIIVGAQVLSFSLVASGITRALVDVVVALDVPRLTLFLVLCVLYILLGTVIDGLSMMLLTLPVLFPIIEAVGFNPIWFGIVLTIFVELGQITPPVGLNLFVIQGISGDRLSETIRGALPFAGVILLVVAILYAFPQVALWLPSFVE